MCHSRPQPISGTSYSLERATARSVRDPGQDFIDELDEARFIILGYSLRTNVPVQILENNRVFDQERTRFLNILCKMCSRQRSVPSSMHATCWYNDQTAEDRHGGFANVFKGVDRGRPVAVKVVRLYLVSDLEMCLSVGPFKSRWRKLPLIKSLADVLQRSCCLEAPAAPEYSPVSRCELGNAQICDDIRVDG